MFPGDCFKVQKQHYMVLIKFNELKSPSVSLKPLILTNVPQTIFNWAALGAIKRTCVYKSANNLFCPIAISTFCEKT